jgi:hypothetical protein
MKVGNIVWFQAYEDAKPIQGRIKRIGSAIEIGCSWDKTDKRVFHELETIDENPNFVFTKTTAEWITKTKQTWDKPEW